MTQKEFMDKVEAILRLFKKDYDRLPTMFLVRSPLCRGLFKKLNTVTEGHNFWYSLESAHGKAIILRVREGEQL